MRKRKKGKLTRTRLPAIRKHLRRLQGQFAQSDWAARPGMPGVLEFIVIDLKTIKIRMDGDKNHG